MKRKKKRFTKEFCQAIWADLRLIDDIMMTVFFDGDCENVQKMINIILERDDLIVKSVKTQYKIANLKGRAVRLDIYAEDAQGGVHNIEFQRERYGAFPKRLRYNQSLLDANALKKGEKVDKLPDVHVIMVMEKNIFEQGELGRKHPLYHIDHIIRETGKFFDDGVHFIYVNGMYQGNDPIGLLIQDLFASSPDKMHDQSMAGKFRQLKDSEIEHKERGNMNAALQALWDEAQGEAREEMGEMTKKMGEMREEKIRNVKSLMENVGWDFETCAKNLALSDEDKAMIAQALAVKNA